MPFNFQDIFKSGFLEEVNAVPTADMALALGLAFAVGLFIFYIYKRCYAGVLYSASFGVTLIALTMITSLLILAVTSNVVLSLGMVGALSIVRFRTAIKDPSDIAFLFWAIAAGIVLAAGFIPLAVAGSLFIGAVLAGFSGFRSHAQPYILVLHCADAAAETAARTAAVALCGNCQIYVSSYVGNGVYGQDNARSITCPKPPVVVMFQSGHGEAAIAFKPYGGGNAIGANGAQVSSVQWLGNTVSWWGTDATCHMNLRDTTYHVIVLMAVD